MGDKYYESWELSDELWQEIKDLIPTQQRDEAKEYKRKEGGGRKRPDYRPIISGILFVLRTGCQWKAMPAKYGKGSNVHRYFQLWEQAGFFQKIWGVGLERYDELKGINWEWLAVDGCITKAPLARESVGANPTDRGKNGDKAFPTRRRTRSTHCVGDVRS